MFLRKIIIVALSALFTYDQAFCHQSTSADDRINAIIAKYSDEDAINAMMDDLEPTIEKYTSDEFIHQVTHADEIKLDKLREWNNKVLVEVENPTSSLFRGLIPTIGIYNKDVIKMGLLGGQWAAHWLDYKRMHQFFIDEMFNVLIVQGSTSVSHEHEAANALLEQVSLSWFDVRSKIKDYRDNNSVSRSKNLFSPAMAANIFMTLCTHGLLKGFKNQLLAPQDRNPFSFKFLHEAIKDGGKPFPLFSLVEEGVLINFALQEPQSSMIEIVNSWFSRFGLLPSLYDYTFVRLAQEVALFSLFMCWYNVNIQQPIQQGYEKEFSEQIKAFRQLYERAPVSVNKKTRDDKVSTKHEVAAMIKQHFKQECTLSFMTWLKFKNKKIAQWKMYMNCVMSLPAWYRLIKGGYNLYNDVTNVN